MLEGYKFEALSLIPDTWNSVSREYIEGREDHVVSNYAQYCSVVKTGIGKSRLILGGEVDAGMTALSPWGVSTDQDAVWDAKPADPEAHINWVELKTSACIESDKDLLQYERKLQKFWAQSVLLGVPKIVVGFRDRHGVLRSLEELETGIIPSLVQKGRATWDGNVCINFAATLLECQPSYAPEGLRRASSANSSQGSER